MKKLLLIVWSTLIVLACKEDDQSSDSGNGATLNQAVIPLTAVDDLDTLLHEIGDARFVLLGEASHGTSEFYEWRAAISKRLIEEKGFTIIGVEGDWPELARFNQYINGGQHDASAAVALSSISRWPAWMWANEEVATFGEWLRTYNASEPRVNFYGLDVYSLWRSLEEVRNYLQTIDPSAAESATKSIACFGEFFNGDEFAYAQQKARGSLDCADELQQLLTATSNIAASRNDEAALHAVQNATIAINAERYYTTALQSSSASWNIRDEHMIQTIERIIEHHGRGSKIIIWAHNTHVGDARATDMAAQGMVNIGQLVRQQHEGEGVYITGFGTYSGTVTAAHAWASQTQTMNVPPAQRGSWESMLHEATPGDKLILMKALENDNNFKKRIGHRAIGVVYDPGAEKSNYVPSILPERYDAFIFIEETEALHPLTPTMGRDAGRLNDSRLLRVND